MCTRSLSGRVALRRGEGGGQWRLNRGGGGEGGGGEGRGREAHRRGETDGREGGRERPNLNNVITVRCDAQGAVGLNKDCAGVVKHNSGSTKSMPGCEVSASVCWGRHAAGTGVD